jgi:hypothetical protein
MWIRVYGKRRAFSHSEEQPAALPRSSGGLVQHRQRAFTVAARGSPNTGPTRIELPPALDNRTRYGFVFVPPQPEDEETINRISSSMDDLRHALE